MNYPRTAQYKRLHTQVLHRRGQTVPEELLALFNQSFLVLERLCRMVTRTRCSARYLLLKRLFFKGRNTFPKVTARATLWGRSHRTCFRVPSAPFFNRYSTYVSLFLGLPRALRFYVKRSSTPGNTSWDFPLRLAVFESSERALCEQPRYSWRGGPGQLQMWMSLVFPGFSGAVVLNSSTVLSQNCEMFRTTWSGRHCHWL